MSTYCQGCGIRTNPSLASCNCPGYIRLGITYDEWELKYYPTRYAERQRQKAKKK